MYIYIVVDSVYCIITPQNHLQSFLLRNVHTVCLIMQNRVKTRHACLPSIPLMPIIYENKLADSHHCWRCCRWEQGVFVMLVCCQYSFSDNVLLNLAGDFQLLNVRCQIWSLNAPTGKRVRTETCSFQLYLQFTKKVTFTKITQQSQ